MENTRDIVVLASLIKHKALAISDRLKGNCTVFQHALKSLGITAIVLSLRISKTARKNPKGLISYKEFKF